MSVSHIKRTPHPQEPQGIITGETRRGLLAIQTPLRHLGFAKHASFSLCARGLGLLVPLASNSEGCPFDLRTASAVCRGKG